jgi:hypothetical protein
MTFYLTSELTDVRSASVIYDSRNGSLKCRYSVTFTTSVSLPLAQLYGAETRKESLNLVNTFEHRATLHH